MKKNLLIICCVVLSLSGVAFAGDSKNVPAETEIKQKACQNVFSFINIDLSVMSPRAAAADISVSGVNPPESKSGQIVPIANKPEPKKELQAPTPPKSKTSLFRLDLLHIFKIQIL